MRWEPYLWQNSFVLFQMIHVQQILWSNFWEKKRLRQDVWGDSLCKTYLKQFAGPCPGRVRSPARCICFNNCFNKCCNVCLSFFSNDRHDVRTVYEFVLKFSAIHSFVQRFRIQFTFFCKNFEQCFNCCLNNCFLSEKCAREAASPGASRPADSFQFASGGAPFFEAFFGTPFFTQM